MLTLLAFPTKLRVDEIGGNHDQKADRGAVPSMHQGLGRRPADERNSARRTGSWPAANNLCQLPGGDERGRVASCRQSMERIYVQEPPHGIRASLSGAARASGFHRQQVGERCGCQEKRAALYAANFMLMLIRARCI